MTTISDPTVQRTQPTGDWLILSARLAAELPTLAERHDLVVACTPGAGHGAAACYLPHKAVIEVDGTILGTLPPISLHPERPLDRYRYPALWGALIHEAAHAQHTQWAAPAGIPRAVADAADLLEESRIEGLQVRRRPADRDWLRACVTTLVTAQLTPTTPTPPPGSTAPAVPPAATVPTTPPVTMTIPEAGHVAGLLLARVDAGILTAEETAHVYATVRDVLGSTRLHDLRDVWQAAQHGGDDQATRMLALGRTWCDILNIDLTTPAPNSGAPSTRRPTGPPPTSPPAGPEATPTPLASAVADSLSTITAATTTSLRHNATTAARAEEASHRARATRTAQEVFTLPPTPSGTPVPVTRPPTPDEQAAARSLARALRTAGYRERAATTLTSAFPPGRLRMRGALAADAQRAAGAVPTARPFTRTQRRTTPTPPLRIAIATDVSGSMDAFTGPVASTAWILAAAARHIPDATAATVLFGWSVRALTSPGQVPTRVTEFRATGSYEDFCRAVDALDAGCDLTQPGAARLLVIVSDGRFKDDQGPQGQQRLDRLRAHGCTVLWIAPGGEGSSPLTTDATLTLADPAQIASHIARAAIRAVAATR